MSAIESYYNEAFSANDNGNIYRPFTTFERLSHERRMALLDNLPTPPLLGGTVVDYGVGSWGIGCVFQKIKLARILYGIDISEHALKLTARVHANDPGMAGKDIRLSRSDGYRLSIHDDSVDLFFAGEAIEHIDLTEPFLEEVHRVLRLGGRAVITTPNAAPFIYRTLGMRWCVGFEHTALMDFQTLKSLLERYFTVEVTKGYNQTFHPALDHGVDEKMAADWVHACEDDPGNATGLIFMVRKDDKRSFPHHTITTVEGVSCTASGSFRDMVLTAGYMGRMVEWGGGTLLIPVPVGASQVALIFWSHDWSGIASVEVAGRTSTLDLYHPIGGAHRLVLDVRGAPSISISALEQSHPASQSTQVILIRAVFST